MADLEKLQEQGIKLFRAGDYERAKSKFEEMLEIATTENNPEKKAEALNNLGVVKKELGDLDGALETLQQALDYYQEVDNELGEAQALGNFGMVEEAAEMYEDAVQSYLDAAAIFEELGESDMAMYTLQALSRLKLKQKEWVSAIAAYEQGISNLPDSSIKKKVVQNLLKMPAKFMGG